MVKVLAFSPQNTIFVQIEVTVDLVACFRNLADKKQLPSNVRMVFSYGTYKYRLFFSLFLLYFCTVFKIRAVMCQDFLDEVIIMS